MLVTMNDVLLPAKKGGYGVGFFNAVNLEMARAVIEAAEEMNAPVMIGSAEVLLTVTNLERVAEYLIPMAQKAKVPVVVHYDHGLTFEGCIRALQAGFTSVMYGCSVCAYEENKKRLAEMVKICHAMGVMVEGELGHVGDNEGAGKLANPSDFYTDPDMAADFVSDTGVDALAVAVGNAHGAYKFPPKLDFDRISTISSRTGLPLVLHGGSGLADDDFRTAVKRGICKVNIFTDLERAGKEGAEKALSEGAGSLTTMISYEIEAMKKVVKEKIRLFGADGKA